VCSLSPPARSPTSRDRRKVVAARSRPEIGGRPTSCCQACPSSKDSRSHAGSRAGFAKIRERPGQIIIAAATHPVPDKQRHVAPLAAKRRGLTDGEVRRNAGHGWRRDKAVIFYLDGYKDDAGKAERGGSAASPIPCLISVSAAPASRVQVSQQLLVDITSRPRRRRWRSASRRAST